MNDRSSGVVLQVDSDMILIRKDFLVDGLVLPCDVFLKMSPGKYFVIGKMGSKCQLSNLASFNNPDNSVFVHNKDHPQLMALFTKLTESVVSRKGVPDNIKIKFISKLTSDIIDHFQEKQVAQPEQLKKVTGMLLGLSSSVLGFQQAMDLVMQMQGEDAKFVVSSCLIALLIAEEMGGITQVAQERIALGCLLQDVGLKFIPKTILEKPRHEWTQHENEIYEAHPLKSVEMLMDMKDISNDVLLMVSEHHENANGTGYPKRTRDIKISPFGRILIVANDLTALLYPRIEGGKSYLASEAVAFMEDVLGAPYNKQVFRALKNLINKHIFYLKQAK